MPGAGAGLGVFAPQTLPPRWKLTKPAYSAQFIYLAVTSKPKKRHSSNMIADLKREKMENANPQKQEFGSPSLQPSLRCQTHAFFANARGLASSYRL